MMTYVQILDDIAADKKKSLTGQMTLFDFAEEEEKNNYELNLPEVAEYNKDQLLAFEKEVLGIYVSGHPLEAYENRIKLNVTANSNDFNIDEETDKPKVADGEIVTIGGMVTGKTVKTTRNNTMMAFITLEDLFGNVEVIIFPKDYERFKTKIEPDQKIFVRGKATVEEEKAAKLICQDIILFESIPQEVWIKYQSLSQFQKDEESLYDLLDQYDGNDSVVIYCETEKCMKKLPKSRNVKADKDLIQRLVTIYSEENIRITEKSIEKQGKMD
jgi:DNA polymerase-3 subunit alpha